MQKRIFLLLLIICVPFVGVFAQQVVRTDRIDWKKFMSQHDMYWDKISTDYYAGAIMGNGLLGTNMYKLAHGYRINIGRTDVTENRGRLSDEEYPYKVGALFDDARLPIGYFLLTPVGTVSSEKMRLSLYDAINRGTIQTDKGKIEFKSYVHAQNNYIIFETEATADEANHTFTWNAQEAISPRVGRTGISFPSNLDSHYKAHPNPAVVIKKEKGYNLSIQQLVAGLTYVVAWKEVRNGNKRRYVITVSQEETTKKAVAVAKQTIDKCLATTPAVAENTHKAWWNNYYPASFVSFSNSKMESFYWAQIYKFACASRKDKPIVDLQGPWPTNNTPWPAIWMNLNIQLTYSWMYAANRSELSEPLWKALKDNLENLKANVHNPAWRHEAIGMGRSGSYDFKSPLNPSAASSNQYEVGNMTWIMFCFYQYCIYENKTDVLINEFFPLLKKSIAYYFFIRTTDANGMYHLPPTASPEYSSENIGPDVNYDLALLRWGLQALIDINDKYEINDAKRTDWQDFLTRLAPYPEHETEGYQISATTRYAKSHRHYSHLMMIYPLYTVNWDNPNHRNVISKSIDWWQSKTGALQGYSYTGSSAMYSSMGDGKRAVLQLQRLLDGYIKPNTLYAETGPVIETPLSAVASLHDLYLQSWGNKIRVFHAVPHDWKQASFINLRTEGAFLVSAARTNGATVFIQVESEAGGKCRLQTGMDLNAICVKNTNAGTVPYTTIDASTGFIEFDTNKGDIIQITRSNAAVVYPQPIAHAPSEATPYGVNSGPEAPVQEEETAIIPMPNNMSMQEGSFDLNSETEILYAAPALHDVAMFLQQTIKEKTGLDLIVKKKSKAQQNSIFLQKVAALSPEEYTLTVEHDRVFCKATQNAGLLYSTQTLLQLITAGKDNRCSIARVHVHDKPQYAWRGFMLDESRHFFGKEVVKQYLNIMSSLKLNRFHWHLTDEPGWRIEIKKYPLLTNVGAKGNWSDRNAPAQYYTQEDIKEIVEHARFLNIMIIPEIDMPGHATAATRAYPELSGGGEGKWQGFTFHPAKESTYEFIDNVLTEVAALFPSPYIHIGGDEVHFGNQSWFKDPLMQEFIKNNNLKDEAGMEHYFIRRIADMLTRKGKIMLGWDEVLNTGLLPDVATAMWWRHDKPELLTQLLQKNFNVILCPRIPCYFDFVQDESHALGRRWGKDYNTLHGVYHFHDNVAELIKNHPLLVQGMQANVWTERIKDKQRLDYMVFPRLLAMAENAWTQSERKNFESFEKRTRTFLRALTKKNINYFDPFNKNKSPEPWGPNEEDLTPLPAHIFQTIMEQVQAFHKETDVAVIEKNTEHYFTLLQPDGSFTDMNYAERAQTNWKPVAHLDRLKSIVLAYTMPGSKYQGNSEVYDKIVAMFQFWHTAHPTSTNWYMQQIACPQRMGVLLILMRAAATPLPAHLEQDLINRMKTEGGRPDQKGSLGTAANKLDIATHWIYRGCLTADKAVLAFGVEQAYHPLRLTVEEGLQHDYSYQQHGSQLYTGGYGWAVIDGISKIATYTMGTPYALSGEKLQLLSSFVRQAYLPVIRGQHFLYNILGRGLSREGALNQSAMAAVVHRMSALDPAHADAYKKAKHRLTHAQQAHYGLEPKHTHFWRSDYTLHQRAGYTIDVRMASKHTGRNENGNGENLKGYFLTDGGMDIALAGDEYIDIFPVWDWTGIPGVTAPALITIPRPAPWYVGGTSAFAGGVSDGKYGASAYLLNDDKNNIKTTAHKSWFFFDDEVVCLGAGIHSSAPETVNTTINQCLLKGPVTTCINRKKETLPGGSSKTSDHMAWVHHNGVGYFFPQGGNITVRNAPQTGSWKSINNSLSDAPITKDVFKMWVQHDATTPNNKYAYIIVPDKDTAARAEQYETSNITIIANTDSVQAVKHNVLNMWGVVFYKEATLRHGSVSISADKGCVLWIKDINSPQVKVHVADPSRMHSAITLRFTLPAIKGTKELTCNFSVHPHPYAGASSEHIILQ